MRMRALPARPAALRLGARGEEHRVAGLDARPLGDQRLDVGRDELGDRPLAGELPVLLLEHDVAEARRALGTSPVVELVEERARLRGRPGRRDRPDHAAPRDHALERLEGHVLAGEGVGDVGDDQRVAQIRLVDAVFQHRLGEGDPRECLRDAPALGELLEDAAQDRLHRLEHVLLGDEAHLDVELVELARRAVRPGVLVAEAGRDLEVAVEARDHRQLLELLRRLRERVELAGMDPRRHEVVARALRRRGGQDRGLELEEAALAHPAAKRVDDRAALHDVGVQLLPPQVEEAVPEPRLLRIFQVAEDRQRQLAGRPQHLQVVDIDLDRAGRQLGVLGAGRTSADAAVDPHHPFRAHPFGGLEGRRVGIHHALRQAVMVPQVDEQHAPVVADAVAPAGEADASARRRTGGSPRRCGNGNGA